MVCEKTTFVLAHSECLHKMILEGFILIDTMSLKVLQEISYDTIKKDTLVNVSELASDKTATIFERIEKFIDEVKNPYIMQCGKTIVEVEFSETDKTVESQIKSYLKSLKTG